MNWTGNGLLLFILEVHMSVIMKKGDQFYISVLSSPFIRIYESLTEDRIPC